MKESFNLSMLGNFSMLGTEFIAPINSVKIMMAPAESWPQIAPTYLALSIAALFVAVRLIKSAFFPDTKDDYLTKLPVVGLSDGWFIWIKATCLSVVNTKDWAFEGYNKFNRVNKPYVIPSIDRGPMVVIPPRQLRKIYNATDNTIDIHDTGNDTIQAYWTVGDREVYDNNFQMDVIRNQLTRNLDKITPIIASELEYAFDRFWGTSDEWREITVWNSCLKLIAGASNAMFIGEPLCRDVQFLDDLRDHATSIFAGAVVINATPRPLKPITGTLIGATCSYLLRKVLKKCLPVVKKRLEDTAKLKADPTYDFTPPYDCLQWIIDECYLKNDPAQLDPTRVAHRMIFLNDISLHSTALMAQNLLFDLFHSDPSMGYVDLLRAEASSALAAAGGTWTRPAVMQLKLIDSTIRESMRLHPFASIGLPRTVVHPNGIMLQEDGVRIPQGTLLAVPLEPVHYDEALYPNPMAFQPLRFADPENIRGLMDALNPGEAGEACNTYAAGEEAGAKKAKQGVTLDDAFLGFGYGRHACPGRFFAMNEVKVFVAHVLLNYEIEYNPVRPKPIDAIWLKLPLHGGKLKVRRRREGRS